MAQLPPKAPNMTQNWSSLMDRDFISTTTTVAATAIQPPSWMDEFLDFSSVRRNARRRSVSDSIAFLPLLEECSASPPPRTTVLGNSIGFERFDDEQLMSMFADEMAMRMVDQTVSSSDPSTPSDQNCFDEEKATPPPPPPPSAPPQNHQQKQLKEEPREVDSSCKSDPPPTKASDSGGGDTIVDPKRVKRILANRQSAQRSRVRKLQYISELERSVTSLQNEVSALSPRVAFFDHQRFILNVDNSALKQRIAALLRDKIFKDGNALIINLTMHFCFMI
ncbi:hypothetical protein HYC85_014613 [Camellia sinensis]|uniref:BZIP domain-containing protein n=1 Tax=Camellia sinensis TaxID=4442 RepID=A0A7J7HA61_CAMSI|nr:hypothetical protein HYC85_014613 [Camellia sinensis]